MLDKGQAIGPSLSGKKTQAEKFSETLSSGNSPPTKWKLPVSVVLLCLPVLLCKVKMN